MNSIKKLFGSGVFLQAGLGLLLVFIAGFGNIFYQLIEIFNGRLGIGQIIPLTGIALLLWAAYSFYKNDGFVSKQPFKGDGMENSFKRDPKDNFEKKELPDGSVEFVFNVSKVSNTSNPYWKKFQTQFLLMIAFVWFFIGLYIHRYEKDLGSSLFMAMLITPIPSWFLYKIFSRTSHVIKVVPNQGVIFLGQSIPFAEISQIYAANNFKYVGTLDAGEFIDSTDKSNSHYIRVLTNGHNLDISGGTRKYIAEKVANEIISYKDKWKK